MDDIWHKWSCYELGVPFVWNIVCGAELSLFEFLIGSFDDEDVVSSCAKF